MFCFIYLAFATSEYATTGVYFNTRAFQETILFAYSDDIPYLVFVPTTITSKNVSARWQNDTMSIFNATNDGTTEIWELYLQLNESNSDYRFFCANNSDITDAKTVNTSYTRLYSGNLTYNQSQEFWCWMDYYSPTEYWTFDVYMVEVHH